MSTHTPYSIALSALIKEFSMPPVYLPDEAEVISNVDKKTEYEIAEGEAVSETAVAGEREYQVVEIGLNVPQSTFSGSVR